MDLSVSLDNKIINGLWVCDKGSLLSPMERLCIHSFCANGHDFRLWVYNDIANVPQPTNGGKMELCDANEILPASKIFKINNSLASFADYFRWKLLVEKGGWWVDMDMVCLRSFDFSEDVVYAWENDNNININVLKFPAGHYLPTMMLNECMNPNCIMPYDTRKRIRRKIIRRLLVFRKTHDFKFNWGEIGGVTAFSLATKHLGLTDSAKSANYFSPIQWACVSNMITDELHNMEMLNPILKNAYGIHWYNEIWRTHKYDKEGTFSEHSPYEVLKQRYLPE